MASGRYGGAPPPKEFKDFGFKPYIMEYNKIKIIK
jgi:hypothetical protein